MAKVTIQRTPESPFEEVDDADLEKTTGKDASGAVWVEYRIEGRIVHRSVTATVTGVQADTDVGGF